MPSKRGLPCPAPPRARPHPCSTTVEPVPGRRYTRTEYFLRATECPAGYQQTRAAAAVRPQGAPASGEGAPCSGGGTAAAVQREGGCPLPPEEEGLLPIGVTSYAGLFSEAELRGIEEGAGGLGLLVGG